ncbi:MAG: hypothetical protein IKT03_05060 [Muribaculaceae bacterium]|nr:hypothetical protein [Muribaculaceae bacterium]
MKHLKEKDLSLDKQEVSSLGGPNGTKDVTDGCPNPTLQTTLDSHNPPCCATADDCYTCGKTCELTKCICHETDVEATCVVSEDPDTTCLTPITEAKDC